MTLTAIQKDMIQFNQYIEKWETCIGKSEIAAQCRLFLHTMTAFDTQVTRAVRLLESGDSAQALTTLKGE